MKLNNKAMLITYADSLGGNLEELRSILQNELSGAVGGIHLLPFFPSSADRGFAPITYREVDKRFGTWEDIQTLGTTHYLMFDYMINHISRQSAEFKDFVANKDNSIYKNLFIRYKEFWQNKEPSEDEVTAIYKRKPRAPYTDVNFADGTTEKLWCTFDEEQIDLNCDNEFTKEWNQKNLKFLCDKNAAIIRLDAFAYATKKAGTSCFFVEPDVWQLLDECKAVLKTANCELLPEIHEHYSMQLKVADKGHYVYDFALPMLLLHGLYTGKADNIINWLQICPRQQFTTLDTHDGIGVVDAKDLMTDEEIEFTKTKLYEQGGSVNRKYSSAAYNNLDIYQINCTYYSALGCDDDAYLTARAIQLFAPGIPQIYYVGLLAGKNDVDLVEKTKTGRDINRHFYTEAEVKNEITRPVVQKLLKLLQFRNTHTAFAGEVKVEKGVQGTQIKIVWQNGKETAKLTADLSAKIFEIEYTQKGKTETLDV